MSLIVVFTNDGTGSDDVGNYDVTMYINKTPIGTYRVEGHQRSDGPEALVITFAAENLAAKFRSARDPSDVPRS